MASILIIDDDALVRKSLGRLFQDMGHTIILAESLAQGVVAARQGVDIVYLDLDLPDGDGLDVIDELAVTAAQPEIIVITGMGSSYGAQKTMESSAWDYISKPASPQAVLQSLESALAYRRQAKKAPTTLSGFSRGEIIGSSGAMLRTLQELGKAAASEASILLRGETGVGKELAARVIHLNSPRSKAAFVTVDCSNLTETLIESTLYGHLKGAFTNAHTDRSGLIAQADGGTLFLDEIGELPLSMQKSFLRVLQERKYRPVGGTRELQSDFRLVAATNRDLEAMIRESDFRDDLLFRIRTLEVIIPPLRERHRDIDELAAHFIKQSCDRYGLSTKNHSRELLRVARGYSWPGNVRELHNVMEAAVIQSGSDQVIYPKHLPTNVRMAFLNGEKCGPENEDSLPTAPPPSGPESIASYSEYKLARDKEYFSLLMSVVDNISEASRISGLSVPSIYRYLAQAGIPTKRKKG